MYPTRKLGEIYQNIQYGYTGKTTESGKYRLLRITDIQDNNIIWDDVPFVQISDEEAKKYLLNEGDIVFARTGATVGKSCLIDERGVGQVFASYLIRVAESNGMVLPQYMQYFFYSRVYWDQILADVVGAAQPNFNGTKLKNLEIPLPPISTQSRIVARLDSAFASIDEQISLLRENIADVENMRKSALGELFHTPEMQVFNKKMGDFIEFTGGSQPPKEEFVYEETEGYVRLIQIRDYKSDKHKVYVSKKSVTKFCTKDDIMVGRYGPPIFQILRGIDGAYNVALMKAKFDKENIFPNYLYWFLNNPKIQEYIISTHWV